MVCWLCLLFGPNPVTAVSQLESIDSLGWRTLSDNNAADNISEHRIPLLWYPVFVFASQVDTEDFYRSLRPLPCFGSHVKLVVPMLTGREDLAALTTPLSPLTFFYFTLVRRNLNKLIIGFILNSPHGNQIKTTLPHPKNTSYIWCCVVILKNIKWTNNF